MKKDKYEKPETEVYHIHNAKHLMQSGGMTIGSVVTPKKKPDEVIPVGPDITDTTKVDPKNPWLGD